LTLPAEYDELEKLLRADYNGNIFELNLEEDGGQWHSISEDGAIETNVAWAKGEDTLRDGRFRFNDVLLDVTGARVDFNKYTNVGGLYNDVYIIEVETYPEDEIADTLEEVFSNYETRRIGKDVRNQTIHASLKEVRINPRELEKYLTTGNPEWDDVIHSLAIDLKEINLSSYDCIDIIDADTPQGRLWEFFDALRYEGVDSYMQAAERQLVQELGDSIEGSGGEEGMEGPGVYFTPEASYQGEYQDGVIGQEYGKLALDMPLFLDSYSQTHLWASTSAHRIYGKYHRDLFSISGNFISFDGLAYLYYLDEDIDIGINKSLSNNALYTEELEDNGVFIPGGKFGVTIDNPTYGWRLSQYFYPYIPVELDRNDYKIKLVGSGKSSLDRMMELRFASKIEAEIKRQIWDRKLDLYLSRDVNNGFEVSPSIEVMPWLRLGSQLHMNDSFSFNHIKGFTNFDILGLNAELFLENDLGRSLMRYGTDLRYNIGEKSFNLWLANLNWQNQGIWQVCEQEIGLGFNLDDSLELSSRLALNNQTGGYDIEGLCRYRLDEYGTKYMSLSAKDEQTDTQHSIDTFLTFTSSW